jgi:hypothetical protein
MADVLIAQEYPSHAGVEQHWLERPFMSGPDRRLSSSSSPFRIDILR